MGKEWLNWGFRKSSKSGRFEKKKNEAEAVPSGCMCAVFQLFDLNHFQFTLNQQPSLHSHHNFLVHDDESAIVLKGVEAPRNSLEYPSMEVSSFSSTTRKHTEVASYSSTPRKLTDLNIPVNIQIKTRCDNKSPRESTSECSGSPCTKTPSLVARLMGLDLLPENGSPSSRHSNSNSNSNSLVKSRLHNQAQYCNEDRAKHLLEIKSLKNSGNGTRSLPETPRVSSSSSRRSDVDQRLSLQHNKENIGEEFDISGYIAKKIARKREARQEDENRSRCQIVKEKVNRKAGLIDITNTIKNKKPSRVLTDDFLTPSSSSKLKLSNSKDKQIKTLPNDHENQTSHSQKYLPYQPRQEKCIPKRVKKPPQASDAIRSPSKIRSLSNYTEKITKKKQVHGDDSLSSKRNTQLSSCWSQSCSQNDKCNGASVSAITTSLFSGDEAEYEYIKRILKRTGLDISTSVSLAKWYTPKHPLDPSIFHHIELFHHTYSTFFNSKNSKLNQRCNRKLIFQLVDELLVDILKPYLDNFKGEYYDQLNGTQLIEILCSRIRGFPSANCEVLEDIDELIYKDLCEKRLNGFEEEGEIMVMEIQGEIMESLVHEMVMELFGMSCVFRIN